MVRGSDGHRQYVGDLSSRPVLRHSQLEKKQKCDSLPDEFTPFRLNGCAREASYLTYVRERGISDHTVGIYRMGYIDNGSLAGRVVIPSFDSVGSVNFWSARSIDPDDHLRYRLPFASKDIISNEHMIDWERPIYLVEGIFDEIALGPQAISLYGKFLLPLLAKRLVEKRPPMIYVCLDSDAKIDARILMRRLVGYDLRCSIVDSPGKDPGSIPSSELLSACIASKEIRGNVDALRVGGIL